MAAINVRETGANMTPRTAYPMETMTTGASQGRSKGLGSPHVINLYKEYISEVPSIAMEVSM